MKEEGFWYSKYEPHYPMPIANTLTEKEAKDIYELILVKEKIAKEIDNDKCYMASYLGPTECRFTNKNLGNKQYHFYDWCWPGDFAPHYVLKYKVKPTDDFLDFLGYKRIK